MVEKSKSTALVAKPRLPWMPEIEDRFGIAKSSWRPLIDAVWPSATSTDSVVLALSYCHRLGLDPFLRVVHIVPMWHSQSKRMIDTVWPGIALYRTIASRVETHVYAGMDRFEYGEIIEREFEGTVKIGQNKTRKEKVNVAFPEYAQCTVYRMIEGQRVPFHGPEVYWLETYGRKQGTELPNEMWAKRPRGQLAKCAEAAALRLAFPEIGSQPTADEMEGQVYRGADNAKDMGAVQEVEEEPKERPKREDYYDDGDPEEANRQMDEEYSATAGPAGKAPPPAAKKSEKKTEKKAEPKAESGSEEKPEFEGEEAAKDEGDEPEEADADEHDGEPVDYWEWARVEVYPKLSACKTVAEVNALSKQCKDMVERAVKEQPAAADAIKIEFNKKRKNLEAKDKEE